MTEIKGICAATDKRERTRERVRVEWEGWRATKERKRGSNAMTMMV